MIKFRTARIYSVIAMVLAVAMIVPLGASCVFAAQAINAPTTSLVIFPFDNTTSAGGKELGQSVASAVRSWLGLSSSYAPAGFSMNTPSIKRAVQEKRLDETTINGPYDADKAIKIGKEMGAQVVLVGSIDDYQFDRQTKDVQVTITTQLYSVKTGEEVKTVALTGIGKAAPGESDESILAGKAIEDAVGKAVKSICVVENSAPAQPVASKKKSFFKSKAFWVLLVGAAGAAIALSSGGSDNDNGGTELPPPPPIQ